MRVVLVVALMLVGCGGAEEPGPGCSPAETSCAGADLVTTFEEAPGTTGRVCQWWADGRTLRLVNAGDGWCLAP